MTNPAYQWISEVLHFCQGLPIILVGCKKDLRYDQKTIEELHKTSQKPVTPEQVSSVSSYREHEFDTDNITIGRLKKSARRSVLLNTWNARLRQMKVFVKYSSMQHVLRYSPARRRRRSALFCKKTHAPLSNSLQCQSIISLNIDCITTCLLQLVPLLSNRA
jgi:hypothetical protein